ncbi:MAG TPA: DUF6471 domain-containing protein [Rhizomicrobium sp.]|nr:DUF6471 domain-containing protein [Rhizomicrobium sp.]
MPKNIYKNNALTLKYEEKAKNLLKGELKRRGVTYTQLVEKLDALGAKETERNLANKISRGGFTAAFLIQCLDSIGCQQLRLD